MRILKIMLGSLILVSCSGTPKFQLLDSGQTGVTFNNAITETDSMNVMSYEYIYNGAGTGVGDLNNDGLQDIIFAGNQVSPRIYLNQGDFRFKDITSNFEGLSNNQWYSSVTVVDINSDRWPDVYFTSTSVRDPEVRKNRLWINGGSKNGEDPHFTEMAERYGIADSSHTINAAFFDYDRDGDLDLYILNNTVSERMNTAYRPKMIDGNAPNNDKLYRNNGDGTFTNVTKEAGIVFEGFGLGLAMGDMNKDGYPDIYISNDFISNDLLYINQGDGTFRNEIRKYISYQSKSSMGNDMADVNNDGNPDMYTMDMMPETYYKKKQTINGFSYLFYVNDAKFGFEHQYLRNMLHLHNGFINGEMLPFSEVGQITGLFQTDWSWSPLFADYDNDGDKDLIVTNGFPRDLTDKDWTRLKVKAMDSYASNDLLIDMAPAIKIPNLAFENKGELNFEKKSNWLPQIPSYSYGASFVDLDNDGDLDYIVNNMNDQAFILKNTTAEKSKKDANYLKIRLLGKEGNTMAIGAKVELWSNGKYQFSEHFLTRGYASCVDPVVHFGLSSQTNVDSVRVTWPASGNVTIVTNIAANQTIEINESTGVPEHESNRNKEAVRLLFSRCDSVLDYSHEQTDFIDFALNQKIIPHKFSQIGPKMAKGDLNGDGAEDIIIGSSNVLPTKAYLRKGNRFEETKLEGLTERKEFSEGDLAIVDIDGDGDNDVVSVAGGYENRNENEYVHYLYENTGGKFVRRSLPVPAFPSAVIRPCDFNHDGNQELFIGGRVKKGMYPYSNHSWIVLNDKGKLRADSAFRFNLGMVTDAIWTDYDGDGWEDLLVAREWNSIALLRNVNGKELVPRFIESLDKQLGMWYSLAAGDFDQDGDVDYIAGNLGENNRYTASDKYPLSLYVIDLDMDGNIDPIMTAYWPDKENKMTEYPVNYLDELWSQSPYLQAKFRDYAPFSYASLNEILGEKQMKKLEFELQVNTTSSYILWNEGGKFLWEKLPVSLQVSPIKKMIVRDLNNDRYPDLIIAGNDYSFDLSTGFYDSNKGMVLINKGAGREKGKPAFDVLPPARSGMLLQGMVESLLWLDGGKPLVVAGFNRSKAAVFEYNKGAK